MNAIKIIRVMAYRMLYEDKFGYEDICGVRFIASDAYKIVDENLVHLFYNGGVGGYRQVKRLYADGSSGQLRTYENSRTSDKKTDPFSYMGGVNRDRSMDLVSRHIIKNSISFANAGKLFSGTSFVVITAV